MQGEQGIYPAFPPGVQGCLLKQASNRAEVPGFLHARMKLHVSFNGVSCPCVLLSMFKG